MPAGEGVGWGSSPDHGEEDGATADEVHQKEDLLPDAVVAGALLTGLDDNVGHVGQDLRGGGGVGGMGGPSLHSCPPAHPGASMCTCSEITIPKTFFSLSDRMYLMKAQPEPIKAMVMKRRAPFSLVEAGRGCGETRGPSPPLPASCPRQRRALTDA